MRNVRTLRNRTTEAEGGHRLDELVRAWLAAATGTEPSKAAVRRLIMGGAVQSAGRALRRPGLPLLAGQQVVVRFAAARLEPVRDASAGWRLTESAVLFSDGVLLAVDKPPGLPTTPTADPARATLVGLVRAWLGSSPSGGAPYLGVHQRLDRDTSGVVLFTVDAAANAGLARQLEGGEVEKTYLALTARPAVLPAPSWRRRSALDASDHGRARRVRSVGSGGQLAETSFRRLEVLRHGLVVEVLPSTGRKHQIRAHLAEAGLPILGDAAYGGPVRAAGVSVPRAMLHAVRLALVHPLTGRPLAIESGLPEDFRRLLASLRRR